MTLSASYVGNLRTRVYSGLAGFQVSKVGLMRARSCATMGAATLVMSWWVSNVDEISVLRKYGMVKGIWFKV